MDFITALQAIQSGKRFRRHGWPEGSYIEHDTYLGTDDPSFLASDGEPWDPTITDIVASDWEEAE